MEQNWTPILDLNWTIGRIIMMWSLHKSRRMAQNWNSNLKLIWVSLCFTYYYIYRWYSSIWFSQYVLLVLQFAPPPPPTKNANYHLYVKTEKSHNFNQEMNLWSQNLLNSSTLLKLVKLGQTWDISSET